MYVIVNNINHKTKFYIIYLFFVWVFLSVSIVCVSFLIFLFSLLDKIESIDLQFVRFI